MVDGWEISIGYLNVFTRRRGLEQFRKQTKTMSLRAQRGNLIANAWPICIATRLLRRSSSQ